MKALVALLLFCALPSLAADHYIYASSGCASSCGGSWSAAYTGFGTGASQINPASMVRGDTYWIAAGSYGNVTFSTAVSGTSVITVEGATTASHGPDGTWSNAYAGVATFGNGTGISISTSYWTINGQAVPGCSYPSNNSSCYSIKATNPSSSNAGAAVALASATGTVTNYIVEYIEIEGTHTYPSTYPDEGINCFGTCNQMYLGYSYVHHVGQDNLSFNDGNGDSMVMEYNWISWDWYGLGAGLHAQGIEQTFKSFTARYNVWQNMTNTAVISDAAAGGVTENERDEYGNIFFWDSDFNSPTYGGSTRVPPTNGLNMYNSLGNTNGTFKFYNNTIANWNGDNTTSCVFSVGDVGSGQTLGTSIAEDNVWYDLANGAGSATNCYVGGTWGSSGTVTTTIQDHNAYLSIAAGTNGIGGGTGDWVATTNPFTNATAGTVAGFLPITPDPFAAHAGATLASPFNADMNGITRGANGTWDRGALQISGSVTPVAPSSPLLLFSGNNSLAFPSR